MRPANTLSRAAARFQSVIEIEKDGQAVDCKSIMGLLTLGAEHGSVLHIRAVGVDAKEAMDLLSDLFENGFEELDSIVETPANPVEE